MFFTLHNPFRASLPMEPIPQPYLGSSGCDDYGVAACPLSSNPPVSLPSGSFGRNYNPVTCWLWEIKRPISSSKAELIKHSIHVHLEAHSGK